MADAISAVSATATSSQSVQVNAEKSMSIDSEPDNRYVAWRQSQINAALHAMKQTGDHQATGNASLRKAEEEVDGEGEEHADRRAKGRSSNRPNGPDEKPEAHIMSGESDHIGTVDYDDRTPFGHRTSFI